MTDVVVLGAGPAGLMAGLTAVRHGARVRILAKGWGTLYWHAGTIDVLGRRGGEEVTDLREALAELIASRPDHPYALAGMEGVESALGDIKEVCAAAGYPLVGDLDRNRRIITGVGAARPTCLVPATMVAGDADRRDPALIVGFDRFTDLNPGLVAANLESAGIPARAFVLSLPSLASRRSVTTTVLARLFDTPEFRAEVISVVRPRVGRAGRIGFPAVLGLAAAGEVATELSAALGVEIFEIPTTPPSIPGLRIHEALVAAVRAGGGRVHVGMEAVSGELAGDSVESIATSAAARTQRHRADAFVLATGGILGGGIVGHPDGSLTEVVLDLPVVGPPDRNGWLVEDFVAGGGHPVFRSGVDIADDLRPHTGDGGGFFSNVFVAGGAIGRADGIVEGSHDGIAFTTGRLAGLAAAAYPSELEGSRT